MFIELLNVCTIESFGDSLGSSSKGHIKMVKNRPCQVRPALVNINSK